MANNIDMYWTGEGTGTVNSTNAAAQVVGTTVISSWAFQNGADDPFFTFDALGALAAFRYPITVNGVSYLGNTTTGFRIDIGSDATVGVTATMPVAKDNVLCGFYLRTGPETDFANLDLVILEPADTTDFSVAQWSSGATPVLRVHTSAGTGPNFNVVKNELYWCQLKHERNVAATLAVWRVSDWTLIGTSTEPLTDKNCGKIFIGANNHASLSPTAPYIYLSNLIFMWTAPVPDATVFMLSESSGGSIDDFDDEIEVLSFQ